MDDLFRRFMGQALEPTLLSRSFDDDWYGDFSPARFAPSLDIADEKDHLRISMELPGVSEDDVEVSVSHDYLQVRGEKRVENEREDGGYYRTERSYGFFERRVPLPVDVEPDGAEASFDKGLLTVRLKKSDSAAQPKSIPVRAAS